MDSLDMPEEEEEDDGSDTYFERLIGRMEQLQKEDEDEND